MTLTKPARLEDHNLEMWYLVLAVSFPKCNLEYSDPHISIGRLTWDFKAIEVERRAELQERLRQVLSKRELLLFHWHCPECEKHELGHWILLDVQTG